MNLVNPTRRDFRVAVQTYRLRDQKRLLDSVAEASRPSWLAEPETLSLLVEHTFQLRDFKRTRALTLRGIRLGIAREVTLLWELKRLYQLGKLYAAGQLLEAHRDRVETSTPLSEFEFGLLGALGRLRTAAAVIDRLRDREDSKAIELLEARLEWMNDRPERALSLLQACENTWSDKPEFWTRCLHLGLEIGQIDEALSLGEKARERFGDCLAVLLSMARVLSTASREREAAALLRDVLELSPTINDRAWIERAVEFFDGIDQPEIWLPVPTLKQRKNYCGPNSLSLVANYWGLKISQVEIAKDVWDSGTAHRHMWEWAEANGFATRVFSGTPQIILEHLERGVPIITERSWAQSGHYYIFVGYSKRNQEFCLRDPDSPDLVRYSQDDFDTLFALCDRWCLAMVPEDRATELLTGDYPAELAQRKANRIAAKVFNEDPRALQESLNDPLLDETPTFRDALALYVANSMNDQEGLRKASQRLLERHPRDVAVIGRILSFGAEALGLAESTRLAKRGMELEPHPILASRYAEFLADLGDMEEALRVGQRLLERYPSLEISYLTRANHFFRLGNEIHAIDSLLIAEEISRGDAQLLTRIGSALIRIGHYDRALSTLNRVLEISPDTVFAQIERSFCLEASGQFKGAIEGYERNVTENPWYTLAHRLLASLLDAQGEPDRARRVLVEGQSVAAIPGQLQIDLARLDLQHGLFEEAASRLDTLLDPHPDDEPALVLRATVEYRTGRTEEALPFLQRALAQEVPSGPATSLLADVYRRLGRHREERELLWTWIRTHQHDASFDYRYFRCLDEEGRDALIAFLAELKPIDKRRLGSVCLNFERRDEARRWLEESVDEDPEDYFAWGLLGDCDWHENLHDEAAEKYERALSLKPNYPWVLRRLMNNAVRREDPKAIEIAERLAAEEPGSYVDVLEVFRHFGQDDRGYAYLLEERERYRNQAELETHCGVLQQRLGHLPDARRHFEAACRMNPSLDTPRLGLAGIQEQDGDIQSAEETLLEGRKRFPDSIPLQNEWVSFLIRRERFREAFDQALAFAQTTPDQEETLILVRDTCLRTQYYEEGRAFFAELGPRLHDSADANGYVALIHMGQGDNRRALEVLTQNVQDMPKHSWSWRLKGMVHERLLEPGLAEEAYRECSKLNPRDETPWSAIVHLERDRGDHHAALKTLSSWSDLSPDNENIADTAFLVCQEGGLQREGLEFFAALENKTTNRALTWVYRGRLHDWFRKPRKALEAFNRALAITKTHPEALVQRAQLKFRHRQEQAGVEDLVTLLDQVPAHKEALTLLLDHLAREGDAETGLARLERALASEPDETELYQRLNDFTQKVERLDDGLRLLEGLRPAVNAPQVLECSIGTALMEAGRLDEAKERFEDAVNKDPEFAWGHSRLGDLASLLDDDDEAYARWEKAIECAPTYTWPYQAIANLAGRRGDFDRQWEALARKLATDPDDDDYQWALQEVSYSANRAEQFREHLTSLLDQSRSPHELHTRIAHVLNAVGERQDALTSVEKALEHNPRYAWAHVKRGEILESEKRLEEALESFERGLRLHPGFEFAAIRSFHIHKKLASPKAETMLLQHIERAPSAQGLFDTYVESQRPKTAAKAAKVMIRLAEKLDDKRCALIAAGELYSKATQPNEAEKSLFEATRHAPRDIVAYLRLCRSYDARGKRPEHLLTCLRALGNLRPPPLFFLDQLLIQLDLNRTLRAEFDRARFTREIRSVENDRELRELVSTCIRKDWLRPQFERLDPVTLLVYQIARAIQNEVWDFAEEVCETWAERRPQNVLLRYLRLIVRLGQRQYTDALEDLRMIEEACRNDGAPHRLEAFKVECLLGLGREDHAIESARSFARDVDDGVRHLLATLDDIALRVGPLHFSRGEFRDAMAWYRRMRSLDIRPFPTWVYWGKAVGTVFGRIFGGGKAAKRPRGR